MPPSRPPLSELPQRVRVRVEVPRGSRIKRGAEGGIDFVSPVPCPFTYGSVSGHAGLDGDPADAVVLGPSLPAGTEVERELLGRVCFVDAGELDDKWICSDIPPSAADERALRRFFSAYAAAKALLGPARALRSGKRGPTRFEGIEWRVTLA